MKNILVIGSLAYDYIMNFDGRFADHILPDKVHILNVSFTAKNLSKQFGGTAGNIAYNLSLLGENPKIVATAGSDFGEYKKWLAEQNIDAGFINVLKNQYTASAHIITDLDDNQITSFHGGAMLCNNYSIREIIKKAEPKITILAPDCREGMILHANELKKANVPYIFDPGQALPAFSGEELKKLISGSKVAVFNDYEMQLFTDKTKIAVDRARDLTEYLIITLGGKGSLIYHKKKEYKFPIAKPKKLLDPTGAGDAYRAGIIKGLLHNWPIEIIGRVAALTSVYTIEVYGTQAHKFGVKDFKQRYKENFGKEITI
jgi:adenosine kinase